MEEQKLCKDCVNFVFFNISQDCVICDYEYWNEENYYNAILYTPEMFGCIEFEWYNDLKDK